MGSLPAELPVGKLPATNGTLHSRVSIQRDAPVDEPLLTVDQLVRSRARQFPDRVVVAYPSSGIEYVDYTMRQLDVFAFRVATQYQERMPVRKSSAVKPQVVAMLGPSNLEYVASMLALTKLGHSVLFLSTRISAEAVASLLKTTNAKAMIVDSRHMDVATSVNQLLPGVELMNMTTRTSFEFPVEGGGDTRLDAALDPAKENTNVVYIIHSSGSTGFPKPIYQSHKGALPNYAFSMKMRAFITLPLFHNHGICNFYRAIYAGKSIHMYNADLPLTCKHLTSILEKHRFEIFYGVPYALKLLAETPKGISLLRDLNMVMYGGSACPDELGNLLVDNGVNLIGHYGATEVGQLMMSVRPPGDKAWNYVREDARLKPFLRWIPRGPNLFECSVLDGWPAKLQSNQPDGSYATKDLFEPHPTIPGAWKYIARLDDTIVLVNGEKFNPIALEGRIRCLPTVAEAVVFGAGRPYLGLAIVPAPSTSGKSIEQILEGVWPEIESANQTVDAFARISKAMVTILPHDVQCPKTDKGSVIRQAFYKAFASDMEAAYDQADATSGDARAMDISELEGFLRSTILSSMSKKDIVVEDDTDLFSLGLDSLQAIQLRSEVLRSIDVGGSKLGQNVVFDYPSIHKLASYLLALRQGGDADSVRDARTVDQQMQDLVYKYSRLTRVPTANSCGAVVVTGSTGSLGAHTAALLARRSSIKTVYCLVRADTGDVALRRVRDSLRQRKLYHTLSLDERKKIRALPFNQSDKQLGLDDITYREVARDLRAVIHCAWSVNFNLNLTSFEKDCIQGVQNLMNLCLAAPSASPAAFSFCSSVSTVARAPADVKVPEAPVDFSWAQGMGYAQSKSVAERMCVAAAQEAGLPARILRIGQIVGDTQHGIWNATEAIPLMLQSAITVGALPALTETPSWLPVDTTASAVVDITLQDKDENSSSDNGLIVANVVNPATFSWTDQLLPALRAAGLNFETVEPREWIRRLRASDPNPATNPPVKLVDFFAGKYDKDLADFPAPLQDRFETSGACAISSALASAPVLDEQAVQRFVAYFLRTAWKTSSPEASSSALPQQKRPAAVFLAGPCGSGKSTVGLELARWMGSPLVEGDSLHTCAAVAKMGRGEPLTDEDRWSWLDRVATRASQVVKELGYGAVAVSCSALRRAYRDRLRQVLHDAGVDVLFVDLQVGREVLHERVKARGGGHYMASTMIDSQLACREEVDADEDDVLPVNAEGTLEEVLAELRWAVGERISIPEA